MLKEISLKGFKSFYNETLDLKSLTVLTGLNSSGKSSVIQALRMLDRVKRKHTHLLPGYGGWKELRNESWNKEIEIEVHDDIDNIYKVQIVDDSHHGQVDDSFPHLIYISAHRNGPQVNIPVYVNDDEPDEFGNNVLKSIDEHRSDIVNSILKRDGWIGNTLEFVLKEWMKIITPSVEFDFRMVPEADLSYSVFNGHRAKNVGFGLSYALPVITALLLGTVVKNSVVIIENPEAHLHARAQTDMAELIARCVKAGAQVIIETHSDHLFDGLRYFVKQNPGFQNEMSCYWFYIDEDTNTDWEMIELDNNGRISNEVVPKGFCDQFEFNACRMLGLI